MSTEQRLARLRLIYRVPVDGPTVPAYPGRQTPAEAAEFEALAARTVPIVCGRPPRRSLDFPDFTCDELTRFGQLFRRWRGLPPDEEPDYPYREQSRYPCVDGREGCSRYRPKRTA